MGKCLNIMLEKTSLYTLSYHTHNFMQHITLSWISCKFYFCELGKILVDKTLANR